MKKRTRLIITFLLAATAGSAAAEDFNSLNVIINLTNDFSKYNQRQQQTVKPPPQHPGKHTHPVHHHGK